MHCVVLLYLYYVERKHELHSETWAPLWVNFYFWLHLQWESSTFPEFQEDQLEIPQIFPNICSKKQDPTI